MVSRRVKDLRETIFRLPTEARLGVTSQLTHSADVLITVGILDDAECPNSASTPFESQHTEVTKSFHLLANTRCCSNNPLRAYAFTVELGYL